MINWPTIFDSFRPSRSFFSHKGIENKTTKKTVTTTSTLTFFEHIFSLATFFSFFSSLNQKQSYSDRFNSFRLSSITMNQLYTHTHTHIKMKHAYTARILNARTTNVMYGFANFIYIWTMELTLNSFFVYTLDDHRSFRFDSIFIGKLYRAATKWSTAK